MLAKVPQHHQKPEVVIERADLASTLELQGLKLRAQGLRELSVCSMCEQILRK